MKRKLLTAEHAKWHAHPRSVISYIGGKSKLVDNIVPILEWLASTYDLSHYIEGTGGGSRMLLNLDSSLFKTRIYNEISPALCALFASLAEKETTYEVMALLEEWGVSEERYEWARSKYFEWLPNPFLFYTVGFDRIEAAAVAYVVTMQSRAATMGSFNRTILHPRMQQQYYKRVRLLPSFVPTLEGVKVSCHSIFDLLEQNIHKRDMLLYTDPPYVLKVTLARDHYSSNSFTSADHQRLVKLALEFKGILVLSGYDNNIYRELERKGWFKFFLKRVPISSSGVSGRFNDEYIWVNAEIPADFIDMVANENYRTE